LSADVCSEVNKYTEKEAVYVYVYEQSAVIILKSSNHTVMYNIHTKCEQEVSGLDNIADVHLFWLYVNTDCFKLTCWNLYSSHTASPPAVSSSGTHVNRMCHDLIDLQAFHLRSGKASNLRPYCVISLYKILMYYFRIRLKFLSS
jgi:hypothetical protein